MRRFLKKVLPQLKNASRAPAIDAQCPPTPIMATPALPQMQSELLSHVSKDVRLLIWEAVLTEPARLLHILAYRGIHWDGRYPGMGHWHCDDPDSLLPTWQHSCFGIWAVERGICTRLRPRSNSNLLTLLQTCRLVFSEALEVLYIANTFSFAGASSMLLFHSLYATNWRTIRRLHISTVFLVPTKMAGAKDCLPPENYNDWSKACSIIGSLSCLQSFKLDMAIWNFYNWKTLNSVDDDSLIAIFQPLQNLVVKEFEIETNVSVDERLMDLLGPLKFRLKQENRPYGDAFQRH